MREIAPRNVTFDGVVSGPVRHLTGDGELRCSQKKRGLSSFWITQNPVVLLVLMLNTC